jgi:hypothetical protein
MTKVNTKNLRFFHHQKFEKNSYFLFFYDRRVVVYHLKKSLSCKLNLFSLNHFRKKKKETFVLMFCSTIQDQCENQEFLSNVNFYILVN